MTECFFFCTNSVNFYYVQSLFLRFIISRYVITSFTDCHKNKQSSFLQLSTRRQVAVLNVVDQVELKDHDTSSVCNQSFVCSLIRLIQSNFLQAVPDDRIRRLSSSNTVDSNTKESSNNVSRVFMLRLIYQISERI